MKAALFDQAGGPEVLRIAEVDKAVPGPGEVLIKVTSAGVNRADVLFRQGRYFVDPRFPSRIGKEAAGIVEAVGDGAPLRAGARVATLPAVLDESNQGGCAEYVVAPASKVVETPASVRDEDAAGVWMQYLTAWGALNHLISLRPGQVAVITAASSSVGLAAIQLANMLGATTVATTTSGAKVDRLKAHGADHVIDLGSDPYVDRINAITDRGGVDVVFDPVAGPMVYDHVKVCKPESWIILYGVLDQTPVKLNAGLLIAKNVNVRGYTLFALLNDALATAAAVRAITDGLEDGQLTLVTDSHYPLEQIQEAHRRMESNTQFGKIIVNP